MTSTSSKQEEIRKEVEQPQVENQPKESFFKRHKKKIIGALAIIGVAATGAYFYVRGNKKADAPVKETAESKAEEAQINEQPQRERSDRDDRRNNRHGGNRQNW